MPKVIGVENGSLSSDETVQNKRGIVFVQRDFKLTYLVLSDTVDDTDEDILDTTGIPPLYYPLNGALCKSRHPKEESRIIHPTTGVPAILWTVECQFSSALDAEDEDGSTDPTSQRPRVSWNGENEDEVFSEDEETGVPIVNACNEPIFVTRPMCDPVLSIRRYEQFPFDPTVMLDYANTINQSPFWGAPQGCALMLPMEVDEVILNSQRYVEVTYRIKFRMSLDDDGSYLPNQWKLKVLHQGNKYRPSAGSPPVLAKKQGQPTTVNLKADGTRVEDGDPVEFLEFNRFPKAPFENLSLGPF